MPFSLKKVSRVLFLNSVPWSLLMDRTGMLLSFSIFLMNRMISSGASLLDRRKNTHVYLEYSSTMTRVYFFPAMDWTLTGPKRSMWRRCRGELMEEICLDLKLALVCFPFSHAEQRDTFV